MNHLLPIQSNPHLGQNPPVHLERFFALKSFVFYILNVCTVGLFASAEAISKQHRILQLNVQKEKLFKQVSELNEDLIVLGNDLEALVQNVEKVHGPQPDNKVVVETGIDDLQNKVSALESRKIVGIMESNFSFGQMVLDLIRFVGNLVANALTLGVYGVYQNYQLKNQIIVLTHENEAIISSAEGSNVQKCKEISGQLGHLVKELKVRTLDTVAVLGEVDELTEQLEKAKQEAATLRTDKVAAETRLNQERTGFSQKDQELAKLRSQLQSATIKAQKVHTLEAEIQRHKTAIEKLPEAHKPLAEIGPIPPKYKKSEDDGVIKGAMDKDHDLDPDFAAAYQERYGSKRSAVEVVVSSLNYAFNHLIERAEKGKKLQINRSYNTPYVGSASVVYNYMVYDLLMGAKVPSAGCEGFNKIEINEHVCMMSSKPEKIVKIKEESGDKKPVAVLHYKHRDDFTPPVGEGSTKHGVDPVGAKWILAKLTEEEREHLLNLLLRDVIDNGHPDLINTIEYMRNTHDPRVKLVATALELITDISSAIQKNFEKSVFPPIWNDLADDMDAEAYVKAEDNFDLGKIPDTEMGQMNRNSAPTVEWTLDPNVLADARTVPGAPVWNGYTNVYSAPVVKQQQPEFLELISLAKYEYDQVFSSMKSVIKHPLDQSKQFDRLKWGDVNFQYHVSHEMIGADFNGEGGDRCMFSNLLAVLVNKKEHLTRQNVSKLKKAMANYLDKPENAKEFETAIKETYKCTVAQYQNWLRGGTPEKYDHQQFKYVYACNVDLEQMTTLEVWLAACTVGVKIGVLLVGPDAKAVVDENGRLVPLVEFYGPNTKEYLLMGWSEVGKTYHGLFPKLKVSSGLADDDEAIEDIENYWQSIDLNPKE